MFHIHIIEPPHTFSLSETRSQLIAMLIDIHGGVSSRGIVNIAFLSDETITELNGQYRNKPNNTDVLSFHYFDDFSPLTDTDIAGEVVMSESKVRQQAEEFEHSYETEYFILLIHSLLHLLGYDHETDEDFAIMKPLEERIFVEFSLSNPEFSLSKNQETHLKK
jgi:probable rRNA maturation factor